MGRKAFMRGLRERERVWPRIESEGVRVMVGRLFGIFWWSLRELVLHVKVATEVND